MVSLETELNKILPRGRIKMRPIDRIAYASDASFYRMIPQAVVLPKSVKEIQALFALSHTHRIPLTFRSAGTSLSGQAVTEGILVDTRRHWKKMEINADGERVGVQPGVIAGQINQSLEKYGRRIGPDPSSIASATIGGILSNNSGGRSVTVDTNAYHTLETLSFVLPNGFALSGGEPEAKEKFRDECAEVAKGLVALKERIETNAGLRDRIHKKYQMRSTMGYSLNALVDFEDPLDILSHLLIGSEGTLGFISEAVLRTIPLYPFKYTGLLFFQDLEAFSNAIVPITQTGPYMTEVMDYAAICNVRELPGAPEYLWNLPETAIAVLVEYQCSTEQELSHKKGDAERLLENLSLRPESTFTADPAEQAALWKVRTDVVPSTFAKHPLGTIAQIEDVIVPVPRVGEMIHDLHALFKRHRGYEDLIIFGHVAFGNVHFIIMPSFNAPEDISRYENFMRDVAQVVLKKYDGSLKGEHATGRNMAPFVEMEWGEEAYQIMKDLKALLDPENLLNPGVIINTDPQANLRSLKPIPMVQSEVDKCIECGHCEWVCPSLNLTLSPRQRIVIQREMARLKNAGNDRELLNDLIIQYQYEGVETCAVDGLCEIACPVNINTALLTKSLRERSVSSRRRRLSIYLSRHFALLEKLVRRSLQLGHLVEKLIGQEKMVVMTRAAERILRETLPKWKASIPQPNLDPFPSPERQGAQGVYFPSCMSRVMGTSAQEGKRSIIETFLAVSERAGLRVWIPEDSTGCCCGMPFSSKGYTQAYRESLHRAIERFWQWSEGGKLPIFVDSSSCAQNLRSCEGALTEEDYALWSKMTIMDPIEFLYDMVLPRLKVNRQDRSVVLHPTCGAVKLELEGKLQDLARRCAKAVTIPVTSKCCGYAGDRGLLFPELTASATRSEADEVLSEDYDGYYSTNLPCEMGMSEATGKSYESIVYLIEEASR
jgi:D-lactate dehydrogenase